MIHFIIILHFIAVSVGVITLLLAWMQYIRCREEVIWSLFLVDLVLTINMILDSVRIYISNNVSYSSPILLMIFELLINAFFSVAILALTNLVSATTGRPIPSKIQFGFLGAFLVMVVGGVIGNMAEINASQYIVPVCFVSILICCILYGVYCIPLADAKYRPITISSPIMLAVYLLALILTNDLPGIPEWVHKIPYFQIIYVTLNILGLIYIIKAMRNEVSKVPDEKSTAEDTGDYLDILSSEYNLTGRELEVVSELILGKNNKEIGDKLFVSPNTVKNHIYNIYKKVGIKNRYELITIVSRNSGKQL